MSVMVATILILGYFSGLTAKIIKDSTVIRISSNKCSTKDRLLKHTFVFHFSISLEALKNLHREHITKKVLTEIITKLNTSSVIYQGSLNK